MNNNELLNILAFREIALRYLPRCGPMQEEQSLMMVELICSVDGEVLKHRHPLESMRVFARCFVNDAYNRIIIDINCRQSCKDVCDWITSRYKKLF